MTDAPATRYARILMPAAQAVALIPSGSRVAMGLGVSQPPAILKALAERAAAADVCDISLYYMLATAIAGETVLRYELRDRIRPVSLFHSGVERALDATALRVDAPLVEVIPVAFSQVPRMLTEHIGVDTLLTTVSPMDEDGNFSFGTNTDYALAVSRSARRVILEVNPHMPRVQGNCVIHVSQVTAVVEHAAPLLAPPGTEPGAEDLAIARTIAGLIEDGACLQMGIGALPDAVCAALRSHQHLGIHTELMTPGLADLMRRGVVDNTRKRQHSGRSVFTFAMGDEALYEYIDGNPLLEAHPVEYVNDPAVIAGNERMVSVNATLQIDLEGACNSEFMSGRQFSAAGGQLDFVRGAYASKGGRSIIACHSTAARGTVSRIVPALTGPVTTPRNDTHIVVTEYGWVDLKGKSVSERARALIEIAHPDFREVLASSMSRQG